MDDLFAAQESADRAQRAEASQRESWRVCWGWPGPQAGELCEISMPVVETEDGDRIYAYTEQARLVSQLPDGRWLAEIAVGDGWYKDGRRVLLGTVDIWPPTRAIRAARANPPTSDTTPEGVAE